MIEVPVLNIEGNVEAGKFSVDFSDWRLAARFVRPC